MAPLMRAASSVAPTLVHPVGNRLVAEGERRYALWAERLQLRQDALMGLGADVLIDCSGARRLGGRDR